LDEAKTLARNPIEFAQLCRYQMALLERMFDDPGLLVLSRSVPGHPALAEYQLLAHGPQPDQGPWFAMNASLVDKEWAPDPLARRNSIEFWRSAISDEGQRRYVTSRLRRPTQYRDVLAELGIWGRLRGATSFAEVELNEHPGEADLALIFGSLRVPGEVKVLRIGSKPDRARKDIKDASRQIRESHGHPSGPLYLMLEGEPSPRREGSIPRPVGPYLDAAREHLATGHSRAVSHVVCAWTSFTLVTPPGARSQLLFTFRESTVLTHPRPQATTGLPPAAFAIDYTSVTHVKTPFRTV
jgi:hypothetical protein